jgi:DNA-directed RNA polymerase specialized sigma subunit
LHRVIRSIRELSATLGRRPTAVEIAEHAGLSQADVSHALQLTRIMQR